MISKIFSRLYIGDADYTEDDLASRKINFVINVGGKVSGLETRWYHLADDGTNPMYMINKAVTSLRSALDSGLTVLVHCRSGQSRSAFIIAVHLERMGMSWGEAVSYLTAAHPVVCINRDLIASRHSHVD